MLYAFLSLLSTNKNQPWLLTLKNKNHFKYSWTSLQIDSLAETEKPIMCSAIVTFQPLLLPDAIFLCTPTLRHQHRWPHTYICKAKPGFLHMLTHRVLALLKNDPNASLRSETFKQLSVITKRIKQVIPNNSHSLCANIFPWKRRIFLLFSIRRDLLYERICSVYHYTIRMTPSWSNIWARWSRGHCGLAEKDQRTERKHAPLC